MSGVRLRISALQQLLYFILWQVATHPRLSSFGRLVHVHQLYWRPIENPASDFPLALIDWRSIAPSDFVKVDLLYPTSSSGRWRRTRASAALGVWSTCTSCTGLRAEPGQFRLRLVQLTREGDRIHRRRRSASGVLRRGRRPAPQALRSRSISW
jgi:hypothetical protein